MTVENLYDNYACCFFYYFCHQCLQTGIQHRSKAKYSVHGCRLSEAYWKCAHRFIAFSLLLLLILQSYNKFSFVEDTKCFIGATKSMWEARIIVKNQVVSEGNLSKYVPAFFMRCVFTDHGLQKVKGCRRLQRTEKNYGGAKRIKCESAKGSRSRRIIMTREMQGLYREIWELGGWKWQSRLMKRKKWLKKYGRGFEMDAEK